MIVDLKTSLADWIKSIFSSSKTRSRRSESKYLDLISSKLSKPGLTSVIIYSLNVFEKGPHFSDLYDSDLNKEQNRILSTRWQATEQTASGLSPS
jgi:hypothetical protein